MRTADHKLSPLGWLVYGVGLSIIIGVAALIALVVLVVQGNGTDELILDQSQRNQRHIDCIIALSQPTIPEFCEPVKQQLIDDGIIPADFNRATTTIPATTP